MLRLCLLLLVYIICNSTAKAQNTSEQFSVYLTGTPLSTGVNCSEVPASKVKLQVQAVYENRYLLKALALKSIGVGGVIQVSSWNAVYQQQGNQQYQTHQFRFNYSTQLHPDFRIGMNLYLRSIKQLNLQKAVWVTHSELGFQYKIDKTNKLFSSFEFSLSKALPHYTAAIYYQRKLHQQISLVTGVTSTVNQRFKGVLALCLSPNDRHIFTLELNNSYQPAYFLYQFKHQKIRLHFGFWYNNQLPVSNQVSLNYEIQKK